jgi:undecaprenyl pyrophosphate synthase
MIIGLLPIQARYRSMAVIDPDWPDFIPAAAKTAGSN